MGIQSDGAPALANWTLITSHGLVLLYISDNPDATIRQTADVLEFSERRVADIIRDLTTEGLVNVEHKGRRNHYSLSPNARFRHPFVLDVPFDEFLSLWRRMRSKRDSAKNRKEADASPPSAAPA